MASRKAAGPDDRRLDRGPRVIEHLAGQLDDRNSPAAHARQLVDDLVANGAKPTYRPAEGMLPASFTYELKAGGDRQSCRRIIAAAKGDPLLWAALVREIGARSGGAS